MKFKFPPQFTLNNSLYQAETSTDSFFNPIGSSTGII